VLAVIASSRQMEFAHVVENCETWKALCWVGCEAYTVTVLPTYPCCSPLQPLIRDLAVGSYFLTLLIRPIETAISCIQQPHIGSCTNLHVSVSNGRNVQCLLQHSLGVCMCGGVVIAVSVTQMRKQVQGVYETCSRSNG
jgi:hypothetical protein